MNATAALVQAAGMPSGSIGAYAGSSAPSGWLLCDGTSYAQSSYPNLYSAIGTVYGSSGGGYFSVPNLLGRITCGVNSGDSNFQGLNVSGGQKQVTITTATMPSHNHGVYDPGHGHGLQDPGHSHSMTKAQWQTEATSQQANYGPTVMGQTDQQGGGYTQQAGTSNIGIQGSGSNIQGLYQTGNDQGHNNMQQFMVLLYIIKT